MKLWQGIAFMLMLLAFPLITIGANRELPGLWWSGLIALAAGGLVPPALRFVPEKNKE